MKLLNQKLNKKKEEPVKTKVSRVIVVTETRNPKVPFGGPPPKKAPKVRFATEPQISILPSDTQTPKAETPAETPIETPTETPKNVQQPPSPTCIREQAQLDATPAIAEQKQTDSPTSTRRWNISFDSMSCGSSPEYFDRNIMGDWNSSPTAERLGEFKQIVSTNMEYVHEQFFGKNLGESAMSAMQKNRAEMNKLVGRIENQRNSVNPVNWILEMENPNVQCHSSMVTWNDVKSCLPDSFEEEKTEASLVM